MFEDLEEDGSDVTPDSPDRAMAWAIYARGDVGGVTPEEAWAILYERYPEEPRFLLLHAYSELSQSRKTDGPKAAAGVFTPSYFLTKVERIVVDANEALYPQIRDLVVFGFALLAGAKGGDARLLAELRVKIGVEIEGDPKRDDRDRAGLRLRRFEREIVKEIHDRTDGGKPLGVARTVSATASASSDWASSVADPTKPRRTYAADGAFARGELVEHPKFGMGVVTGIEPGKVVILFESGVRKLVAGA